MGDQGQDAAASTAPAGSTELSPSEAQTTSPWGVARDVISEGSWLPVAASVGGLAGAAAIVYGMGGFVMWSRLNGAGVEANQAIGAIPQQTLFAVGAQHLVVPAILSATLFAATFLFDRRRRTRPKKERPPAPQEPAEKPRARRQEPGTFLRAVTATWNSKVGRLLRRLVWLLTRPVVVPLRWYFRYVPDWLIGWIPLLLFLPSPEQTVINGLAASAGAAVGEWAREVEPSRWQFGAVRIAFGLAIVTTVAGLASELLQPHALPKATVVQNERPHQAEFIAVSGGDAYLVEHSHLTIIPSSSYERLVVRPGKEKRSSTPSLFSRVWPY